MVALEGGLYVQCPNLPPPCLRLGTRAPFHQPNPLCCAAVPEFALMAVSTPKHLEQPAVSHSSETYDSAATLAKVAMKHLAAPGGRGKKGTGKGKAAFAAAEAKATEALVPVNQDVGRKFAKDLQTSASKKLKRGTDAMSGVMNTLHEGGTVTQQQKEVWL